MEQLIQTIVDFINSDAPENFIALVGVALCHSLITLREFTAAMLG